MQKLDLPHFDPLPYFREKYLGSEENIFYDSCHLTPEGNRYLGTLLGEFITRHILVNGRVPRSTDE